MAANFPFRNVPRNSDSVILLNAIQDGDIMVNFRSADQTNSAGNPMTEYNAGRYYKQEDFSGLLPNPQGQIIHPGTRQPIIPASVVTYRARIVDPATAAGGGGSREQLNNNDEEPAAAGGGGGNVTQPQYENLKALRIPVINLVGQNINDTLTRRPITDGQTVVVIFDGEHTEYIVLENFQRYLTTLRQNGHPYQTVHRIPIGYTSRIVGPAVVTRAALGRVSEADRRLSERRFQEYELEGIKFLATRMKDEGEILTNNIYTEIQSIQGIFETIRQFGENFDRAFANRNFQEARRLLTLIRSQLQLLNSRITRIERQNDEINRLRSRIPDKPEMTSALQTFDEDVDIFRTRRNVEAARTQYTRILNYLEQQERILNEAAGARGGKRTLKQKRRVRTRTVKHRKQTKRHSKK